MVKRGKGCRVGMASLDLSEHPVVPTAFADTGCESAAVFSESSFVFLFRLPSTDHWLEKKY